MKAKMPKNLDTFGNRLQAIRAHADNISYNKLADAIIAMVNREGFELTGSAIHKWEKKGGNITVENVEYLARYFRVSPGWLLWGEIDTSMPSYLEPIYNVPNNIRQIRGSKLAVRKKKN